MKIRNSLLAGLTLPLAFGALAGQDIGAIEDSVQAFLEDSLYQQGAQEVEVSRPRLDARLQLADCSQPLDLFLPHEIGNRPRVTVGVRCQGSEGWTLYVSAAIRRFERALVANRTLDRGDTIGPGDLSWERVESGRLHGQLIDDEQAIIGAQVRRRIPAQSPIKGSSVCLVCKGEAVAIMAQSQGGSLRLSVAGSAMMDGARGERIRVQNLSSRQVIEAQVTAPGQVTVLF